MTHFYQKLSYVLVVLNLSILKITSISDSVMTSACEPNVIVRSSLGLQESQENPGFPVLGVSKLPI